MDLEFQSIFKMQCQTLVLGTELGFCESAERTVTTNSSIQSFYVFMFTFTCVFITYCDYIVFDC